MSCQTPVRPLTSVGRKAGRHGSENGNSTTIWNFGIWRAFGLLLNYRINRNSNREEETVLLLQIPGWGAEMQTCGLFRAYENECF